MRPAAQLDGSGNVVARFVYGTKATVPDYMIKGGVTYGMISDHVGSVRLVVDTATGTADGAVINLNHVAKLAAGIVATVTPPVTPTPMPYIATVTEMAT